VGANFPRYRDLNNFKAGNGGGERRNPKRANPVWSGGKDLHGSKQIKRGMKGKKKIIESGDDHEHRNLVVEHRH